MTRQVVLITGSSRGIGRATALTLAEHGARVVITARDMTALDKLASEIRAHGGQCLALCMDVTDPESIRQAIHQARAHFGQIDVLINNAGILHFANISDTSTKQWTSILTTNLTGPFLCIQEVLPIMKAQGCGHIINIASQAGRYGFPNLGAYSSSKFGLIGLSQSLGRGLKGSGIKVSYLCPGAVKTDMLAAFPESFTAPMQKDTPEHIAQCIYDLIAGQHESHLQSGLLRRLERAIKRRLGLSRIEIWNSSIKTLFASIFISGSLLQETVMESFLADIVAISV